MREMRVKRSAGSILGCGGVGAPAPASSAPEAGASADGASSACAPA